jgi:polysaccharide deacetylase 2 family uncharacterized protein YibQ
MRTGFWFGLLCISVSALAQPPAGTRPGTPPGPAQVAIVIDDLGHNLRDARRITDWREPVALAILPHTRYSHEIAEAAHRAGKEILLHLPMDADGEPSTDPGPGRIETNMPAPELRAMLAFDLDTVPHASGVNNHMGSRLTQSPVDMDQLMRALAAHPTLFFLDSRTSPQSVAARVAREHGIDTLERDIFLDAERGEATVRASLAHLDRQLATRGRAVVIGHPYPETLAALEQWLPAATARGIRVVPLSVMLKSQGVDPHAERTAASRPGL